jgi:hypothetical protein
MVFHPHDEQPIDLGGVPGEEGVSEADAAGRLDLDPEEQRNYTERQGDDDLDENKDDVRADAAPRGRTNDRETDPEDGAADGPDDREESIALDAPEYDES